MNKQLSVITGIGTSILLAYGCIIGFLNPVIQASGKSPESFMGVVFLIIYPICLLIGSSLTGILLAKKTDLNLKKYLFYSPGLYLAFPFVMNGIIAPVIAPLMLLASIAFILVSMLGLWGGIKLNSWRINQKSKA